jgi:predicted PurR-regulated permease PerM
VKALGDRLHLRRSLAVAVVTGAALAIAVAAIVVLAPIAAREAGKFQEEAPELVDGIGDLPVVGGTLRDHEVPDRLRTWATELPERLNRDDAPLVGLFQSAVGGLVAAVAVISLTIAALLDGPRLVGAVRRAVPSERRALYDRASGIVYRTVGRYFAGSLVVALLSGTGVLVVGLLVGIPLAPLVAVWVTLTNLIPQIGGLLGGGAFVLAGIAAGPTPAVICLVWFLAYQQIENHVIQPLIVGEAVDLSPSVTMIGALIGAATAGVPGALVAIPTIGAVKGIVADIRRARGVAPEPVVRHPSPWRRLGGRVWQRRRERARRRELVAHRGQDPKDGAS